MPPPAVSSPRFVSAAAQVEVEFAEAEDALLPDDDQTSTGGSTTLTRSGLRGNSPLPIIYVAIIVVNQPNMRNA